MRNSKPSPIRTTPITKTPRTGSAITILTASTNSPSKTGSPASQTVAAQRRPQPSRGDQLTLTVSPLPGPSQEGGGERALGLGFLSAPELVLASVFHHILASSPDRVESYRSSLAAPVSLGHHDQRVFVLTLSPRVAIGQNRYPLPMWRSAPLTFRHGRAQN